MNLRTCSRELICQLMLLLASIAISAFAWGQHITETRAPSEHAMPQLRHSAPSPERSPAHAPVSAPARAPSYAPAPSHVTTSSIARPKGDPRGTANTSAGRFRSAPAERVPDPIVDHIGDISEYRRGTDHPAPAGIPLSLRGGVPVSHQRSNIRLINRDGMQIQHSFRGGRMIVSERNGERIVTTGGGRGYVQRGYVNRDGRSFHSRTYYDGGVYRVGIYRDYNYGGHLYYGYYPGVWYHPAFYSWAYRPWGAPVPWGVGPGGWGWAGAAWYRYYGGYFAPYPLYSSAAFWLTDYLIAADLQAAYAAQAQGSADQTGAYNQDQAYLAGEGSLPANSSSATMSPEVKQAIADEVTAQLAAQQQQSSGGQSSGSSDGQAEASASANGEVPPALDPARRTFVVFSDITVTSEGRDCELTAGDMLTRITNTPDSDQKVTATVSATKKADCAIDKHVTVSVEALQEMRNHFDEQLNQGMKVLAQKQGTGGLPTAPDTGTTASDVPLPAPDTTVAKVLTDQEAAADRTEAQVKRETAEDPAAPGLVITQGQQETSLGDIARQVRAQKQQAQTQSDPSQAQGPAVETQEDEK